MNPIRQFELITEIPRRGSITEAAESLHISQPTLSKYLANVERQLGMELFDRTTIPIKLTPAGEIYVTYGNKIIDTYHQLDKSLEDLNKTSKNEVRVGVSQTRAPYIMPKIIRAFYDSNPKSKIVVSEKPIQVLNSELRRGDLDLIVSILTDETRQFEFVHLFSEKILLAMPLSYADANAEEVFSHCRFISPGGGVRMSKVLSEILNEYGAHDPFITVQSIETALSLVGLGLGATITPSYLTEGKNRQDIVFKEIPDILKKHFAKDFKRQVCIFYRKEQYLTSAEKSFIDICKSMKPY